MKEKTDKKVVLSYIYCFLPFVLMDLLLRITARKIVYTQAAHYAPNILFTLTWIGFLGGLSLMFKRRIGRVIYGLFFAIFAFMTLTNVVYYKMTGYFFNFNLAKSASEGSEYIMDAIKGNGLFNWIGLTLIILAGIWAIIKFPKREKNYYKGALVIIICFLAVHTAIPSLLGSGNTDLQWDSWRKPRNVYENFADSNKCMKICGIFEYTVRDFYVNFLKSDQAEDPEELKLLEQAFANKTSHEANEFTGIFKGKNVIFVQLEGIDSWMLNESDTPTLYKMKEAGIDFTNHYSYYNGGGSTFNSELAVNTGYLTPISYIRNAYTFNSNDFRYSLPNVFKGLGYKALAFHKNSAEYYSRGLNYKNWGYEAYHGLQDEFKFSDKSFELDRKLIEYYGDYYNTSDKFMHYIITFTPHTPFVNTKGVGQLLAELNGKSGQDMTEEEVAKMFASETDLFMEKLLEKLKETGHYEDTVIVAYADHYLYTIEDKSVLDKYKETSNNLINHTPFFIWSADIKGAKIDKINSQLDILPTVLNMFGIDYYNETYVGEDIMDASYPGYAFFTDYSWYYDGKYYEGTDKVSGDLEEIQKEISEKIKKNDYTLKYDYFSRLK